MAIEYKGRKWIKEVNELKHVKKELNKNFTTFEMQSIQMFITGRYDGYLQFYTCLSGAYGIMARDCYLEDDYSKIREYIYLSGVADLISKCLFHKGINPEYHEVIRREIDYVDYTLFQLIVSDAMDTPYLYIVEEDNLIMHMFHQRYDEARKILEKLPDKEDESREVYYESPVFLKPMYLGIINRDEKLFNEGLEKRIKKYRRNMVGYSIIIDIVSIALIKLAKQAGVQCTVDVIEIPKLFFDDSYAFDKEKVKLPFYEEFLAEYKDILFE